MSASVRSSQRWLSRRWSCAAVACVGEEGASLPVAIGWRMAVTSHSSTAFAGSYVSLQPEAVRHGRACATSSGNSACTASCPDAHAGRVGADHTQDRLLQSPALLSTQALALRTPSRLASFQPYLSRNRRSPHGFKL